MTKASLKRLHPVWFQLPGILEKAGPWRESKDQWLPGGGEEAGVVTWAQRTFRKWDYSRWNYNGGYHFSIPTHCTAPSVDPDVKCGLWVLMTSREWKNVDRYWGGGYIQVHDTILCTCTCTCWKSPTTWCFLKKAIESKMENSQKRFTLGTIGAPEEENYTKEQNM